MESTSEPEQTQTAAPAAITWDWLHSTILQALRHIEPGAPMYLTADVLTDELLAPLKRIS